MRILLLLSLVMLVPASSEGQTAPPAQASDISAERAEALAWLKNYVGDELLLKPDDVQKLISQIKTMSDPDFEKWYNQTKSLRKMLDSPEWQATRAWLKDFLNVQAIYSPAEIDDFRTDVAKMTPNQLMEVMRRLERKHQSLIAMREASQQNRKAAMSLRNDLTSAQRSTQIPAGGGRYGARSVQSYFGPSSSGPVRSSYAQRKNSYRRNLYVPGGLGWYRW
ncbi:MAG: hypothetical protein GY768_17325 [Planctomycetaceae bacterium]|nr:hypothetical protein [Planctomycetaceae bacterium]